MLFKVVWEGAEKRVFGLTRMLQWSCDEELGRQRLEPSISRSNDVRNRVWSAQRPHVTRMYSGMRAVWSFYQTWKQMKKINIITEFLPVLTPKRSSQLHFPHVLFTVNQERKVNKLPCCGSVCQHLARECLQSNQQDHTGDMKWGIDHYVIKLYLFFILFWLTGFIFFFFWLAGQKSTCQSYIFTCL